MEQGSNEDIPKVTYMQMELTKLIIEVFNKLTKFIDLNENQRDEKDILKKTENMLSLLSKRFEYESKNERDPTSMLNLSNIIETYYIYVKKSSHKISVKSLIAIGNKLIPILTSSLFLAKSSEICQLLQLLLNIIFTNHDLSPDTTLLAINTLFHKVEPQGKNKLFNPISIELIKFDMDTKNKYLKILTEHFYHSNLVNDNIISLMTGLMDCSGSKCCTMDLVCVEYVLDFTLYLFCDYLLYYHYLYVNNKRIGKERADCLYMLEKLGNKMVTDFINMLSCVYIEKVKVCIMVLILYERELRISADFNGLYNKDENRSFLLKMLQENKTKNELFIQCLIDIIDIDTSYDLLKTYLTDIINELNKKLHVLFRYNMEQIFNYKSKELFDFKIALYVLYMNSLENVSIHTVETSSSLNAVNYNSHNRNSNNRNSNNRTSNTNNDSANLHYIPQIIQTASIINTKLYFHLPSVNDNASLSKFDLINKKHILSCVLNDIISLLQIFEDQYKLKSALKTINKALQYTTISFNMIIQNITNDIYEDIILDFIFNYVNYRKEFIQYEWTYILQILSTFYKMNKRSSGNCLIKIIQYIESLKYVNNFNGNIYQLLDFVNLLDEEPLQLFQIILRLELPERGVDKLIKNIKNLFSVMILYESEDDSSSENENQEKSMYLNENVSRNQMKVIYRLLDKIFNELQNKEEKGNDSNPNKMSSLYVVKDILTTNTSSLIYLFINDFCKKDYIFDLLSFVINIICTSFDDSFIKDILNSIFIQVEKSNSIYTITIPYFINNLTRTPTTIPKLQIMFDVIETRLQSIVNDHKQISKDFSSVYVDLMCNSKVNPSFQIINTPIIIKHANFIQDINDPCGILNTGAIANYLIFSIRNLDEKDNEESLQKIKESFVYLTYANFLILKGIDFKLFYETFQKKIDDILNILKKGVYSKETDVKNRIKRELKYSLNCIVNIAFHLDFENGDKNCTYALCDNGLNEYPKLKCYIILNLISKLGILADIILNKDIMNDIRNRVDNLMDTASLSSLKSHDKNSDSLRTFMKILNVLEIYLFSINTKAIIDSHNEQMNLILNSTIDICVKLICMVKFYTDSLAIRFLAYKFFFMIKELLCLNDDFILKVVFLIIHISHKKQITERLINNPEIVKMFDSKFMEWISYTPTQIVTEEEKKEFQLTSVLFFEVSCDYLINYFLTSAKNKDNLYKCFTILFNEIKNASNESSSNEFDLLDISYIREKIFFENVKWCLGSNSIKDNMVKPQYKKFDKTKKYPHFFIDKDTYGLILSYEKDSEDNNKYNINIRTAVSNIQYSISRNIIEDESDSSTDDGSFVMSMLSQINANMKLKQISIDNNFITMLTSLDSLSVYRDVYCKIFYRNISKNTNKPEIVNKKDVSNEFIMFLNALGSFELIKNKIEITSCDVNNKIQYVYCEKNINVNMKVENSVTLIWCNSIDTNYEKDLLVSVNDSNEYYICVYPVSVTHYAVKIVDQSNENKGAFQKLFHEEVVLFIGERMEVLVEYISKMVNILNSFSRVNEFVNKQKNKNDKMVPDSHVYLLHNYDNLFKRYSQINTIGEKYLKGK